jgi:hypothetical protein
MLPTKQCCIAAFLVVTLPIFTQNLLSSNSWIPGTGSDSELIYSEAWKELSSSEQQQILIIITILTIKLEYKYLKIRL